jgi:ferredoxin
MQVTVDQSKCQGHGQCFALAPDVYQIDDDGYIAIDGTLEILAGLEESARRGAAACPEQVFTIVE